MVKYQGPLSSCFVSFVESKCQKLQCLEVYSFRDLLEAPGLIFSSNSTPCYQSLALGSLKYLGVSLLSQQNHTVLAPKLVLIYVEKYKLVFLCFSCVKLKKN